MTRTFEDAPAVRSATSLLLGLVGPSGSGKTFSALRLATGILRVTPGEVFLVDTESRRALHYADQFRFRHVVFDPPFAPLDYLAAFEHCVSRGAKVVVFDSASHLHEGQGGCLDMHEDEIDRLIGGRDVRRDSYSMPAWAKPKRELAQFKLRVVQSNTTCIFCFRAKEKIKMPKKGAKDKDIIELGWQPIADTELVYEMTLRCLLPPSSDGAPRWEAETEAERQTFKLPLQFRSIFASKDVQLSEDIGEQLARWAAGTTAPVVMTAAELCSGYAACSDSATYRSLEASRKAAWAKLTKDEQTAATAAAKEAYARLHPTAEKVAT
jgi:ABC-type dipeptide/oligopeptide/nickel transport system ATPase subunit